MPICEECEDLVPLEQFCPQCELCLECCDCDDLDLEDDYAQGEPKGDLLDEDEFSREIHARRGIGVRSRE